jgi:hypothetical protein
MAPPQTTKSNDVSSSEDADRPEPRIPQKQDESENSVDSDDEYISDANHDDQEEDEPEETQSKSAEELLSTMVAGVRPSYRHNSPLFRTNVNHTGT